MPGRTMSASHFLKLCRLTMKILKQKKKKKKKESLKRYKILYKNY